MKNPNEPTNPWVLSSPPLNVAAAVFYKSDHNESVSKILFQTPIDFSPKGRGL